MEFVIAHLDQILSIAGLIIAWLIGRPWAKEKQAFAAAWMAQTNTTQVWSIVVGVVSQLYVDVVRELKETGKFDAEAKRRIQQRALELIKLEIQEHGLTVLYSSLPGMIEVAVLWLKSKGMGSVLPSPFSPASSAASASVPPPELGSGIPGLP